jgi:hypothetical protein
VKKGTTLIPIITPIIPIIPIILILHPVDAAEPPIEPPQQFVAEPQVLERGPHHRILQFPVAADVRRLILSGGDPDGARAEAPRVGTPGPPAPPPAPRNSARMEIHELQAGLHRWTPDRGWVETHPTIESFPDGAVIRNLQYAAIFAPNLATPNAFDIQLPPSGDSPVKAGFAGVRGHLFGLAYTDNGTSVLIAEVKDSIAVIGGPDQNELTYPDAFTDFAITVKYIAHRDRLSQLLLIEQQLPHPSEWGLTDDAVLEILTEFTEFPDLTIEPRDPMDPLNGVQGEHLRFATMEFVTGKAFSIPAGDPAKAATPGRAFSLPPVGADVRRLILSGGDPDGARAEAPDVRRLLPIQKSMQLFEGNRWFLVEKVSWRAIAPELAKLPPVAKTWRKKDRKLMAGRDAALRGPNSVSISSTNPPILSSTRSAKEGASTHPSIHLSARSAVPVRKHPRHGNTPSFEISNMKSEIPLHAPPIVPRHGNASNHPSHAPRVETPRAEAPSSFEISNMKSEIPLHAPTIVPRHGNASNHPSHAPRVETPRAEAPLLPLRSPVDPPLRAPTIVPRHGNASNHPSHGSHAPRITLKAKRSATAEAAFVLDWELVTTINSNRWKADTTWYISGPVTVKTNVFEGGTVIKYAPTNNARLTITGPVTCLATNYSAIIMTARDDHSIGTPIGASSLAGLYAGMKSPISGSAMRPQS